MKNTNCTSPNSPPSELLFSQDMVSISSFKNLDTNYADILAQQNQGLAKQFNTKIFELEQRLNYKKTLEIMLSDLTRKNEVFEDPEITEESTEINKNLWHDKVLLAELDTRAYKYQLYRLKQYVHSVKNQVETIRGKLTKAEFLSIQANRVPHFHEENAGQNEEEQKVLEWQHKLENAKKQHQAILLEIEKMKERIIKRKNDDLYNELKMKKISEAIGKLREKRHQYNNLLTKLKSYELEFIRQHDNLTKVFQASKKEEIMAKKETRDIQMQSEQNDYTCKIMILHDRSQFLVQLKQQRDNLIEQFKNQNNQNAKNYLFQKGEYYLNSNSGMYSNSVFEIMQIQRKLEDRFGFITKVIGGIKHIIYKLQKNDTEDATGSWYNLAVIAGIDEIDTNETRPKFSKLLMILEQKIQTLCAFFMQQIKHFEVEKYATEQTEIDPNRNIKQEYVLTKGVIECVKRIKNHLETKNTFLTKSGDASPQEKDLNLDIDEKDQRKPITGTALPQFGRGGIRSKRTIIVEERFLSQKNANKGKIKEIEEPDIAEDGSPIMKNMDITSINENIREVLFNLPYSPSKLKEKAEPILASENDKNLQTQLCQKFNQVRVKIKFDKEMKKSATRKFDLLKLQQQKGEKKRVTATTLEIANALKNRPPEVIELATTTFDALEKYKKSIEMKQKKDADPNHKLIPNFMNVLLHMKKSRGDETIGKIAAKCSYYPIETEEKNIVKKEKSVLSNPQSPTNLENSTDSLYFSQSKPKNPLNEYDIYMNTIGSRLQNIRSLNQLEKLRPKGFTTAFDKYCAGSCLTSVNYNEQNNMTKRKNIHRRALTTSFGVRPIIQKDEEIFPWLDKDRLALIPASARNQLMSEIGHLIKPRYNKISGFNSTKNSTGNTARISKTEKKVKFNI